MSNMSSIAPYLILSKQHCCLPLKTLKWALFDTFGLAGTKQVATKVASLLRPPLVLVYYGELYEQRRPSNLDGRAFVDGVWIREVYWTQEPREGRVGD
jgi:hypothetical protein